VVVLVISAQVPPPTLDGAPATVAMVIPECVQGAVTPVPVVMLFDWSAQFFTAGLNTTWLTTFASSSITGPFDESPKLARVFPPWAQGRLFESPWARASEGRTRSRKAIFFMVKP
jgi:hypothetical protein